MKYLLFSIIVISTLLLGCKGDNQKKQKLENKPTTPRSVYMAKGKEIAKTTFETLLTELQKGLQNGGLPHGVKYCNTKAMPITDSLSKAYNVSIKRVSDKYRNPNNKPTTKESEMIDNYKKNLAAGIKIAPTVKNIDGKSVFYAPIKIQGMCLACHGDNNTTPNATIKELYPNDLATGYKVGDLRGMWSITFNN
ncbi:MAG: DUF3365 domain-containing protein [Saprospiraceae bacterium]